jgi:phenylalanyl-tRNA synthetase beta chain
MRPINNVVDVTNYVMLEYGQPLHAFDFNKLRGQQIIVRRAGDGERISTLDGAERILKSSMLVIADKERSVAVAGIMGGSDTEVIEGTTSILLESANFNRAVIHKGSTDLKLGSEASLRFEKGLSPELAKVSLLRATRLMMELTGAIVAKGIIDVYPGKHKPSPLVLPVSEVKRLLGLEMAIGEIVASLESLGFRCKTQDSSMQLHIEVPWWRSDITCKADVVEEIARVFGYQRIPATTLASSLPSHELLPIVSLRHRIRNIMTGCGFQEILTYSLTSIDTMKNLSPNLSLIGPEPLSVANPMSRDLECLRTTLRSGVLSTLARNQRFQQRGFRLFELGKIFLPQAGKLPEEKEVLCAVINGSQDELFWRGATEPLDFFVAKGVIETLFSRLGLDPVFIPDNDESFCPGKSASVVVNNEKIGVIGELHPGVAAVFDILSTTFMMEVDVDKLLLLTSNLKKFQTIPRYPSMTRDMALVIDEKLTYEQIYTIVRNSSPLIRQVHLFDLYCGEQVPSGKKSLAFRIIYQSDVKTLSDKEVDLLQQHLCDRLSKELGATLRD